MLTKRFFSFVRIIIFLNFDLAEKYIFFDFLGMEMMSSFITIFPNRGTPNTNVFIVIFFYCKI